MKHKHILLLLIALILQGCKSVHRVTLEHTLSFTKLPGDLASQSVLDVIPFRDGNLILSVSTGEDSYQIPFYCKDFMTLDTYGEEFLSYSYYLDDVLFNDQLVNESCTTQQLGERQLMHLNDRGIQWTINLSDDLHQSLLAINSEIFNLDIIKITRSSANFAVAGFASTANINYLFVTTFDEDAKIIASFLSQTDSKFMSDLHLNNNLDWMVRTYTNYIGLANPLDDDQDQLWFGHGDTMMSNQLTSHKLEILEVQTDSIFTIDRLHFLPVSILDEDIIKLYIYVFNGEGELVQVIDRIGEVNSDGSLTSDNQTNRYLFYIGNMQMSGSDYIIQSQNENPHHHWYHLTIEGHQVQAELKKSVYYQDQAADNFHGLLYPLDFTVRDNKFFGLLYIDDLPFYLVNTENNNSQDGVLFYTYDSEIQDETRQTIAALEDQDILPYQMFFYDEDWHFVQLIETENSQGVGRYDTIQFSFPSSIAKWN